MVFDNRILTKTFGHKWEEASGDLGTMHTSELRGMYSSQDIRLAIKSRKIRWAVLVAIWGRTQVNECRVLLGKREVKRPLGRFRRRWE
jgi:hypothetical protein